MSSMSVFAAAAFVLALVELIRSRFLSLLAWAVVLLSVAVSGLWRF